MSDDTLFKQGCEFIHSKRRERNNASGRAKDSACKTSSGFLGEYNEMNAVPIAGSIAKGTFPGS